MENFLSHILDDLESGFSQQMLIEFFLCAKRWSNTPSWHLSGHRGAGTDVNSSTEREDARRALSWEGQEGSHTQGRVWGRGTGCEGGGSRDGCVWRGDGGFETSHLSHHPFPASPQIFGPDRSQDGCLHPHPQTTAAASA